MFDVSILFDALPHQLHSRKNGISHFKKMISKLS